MPRRAGARVRYATSRIRALHRVDAIYASPAMAALSSRHTGITTQVLRVEDLDGSIRYDGIWACASLLHFTMARLPDVFPRMARAAPERCDLCPVQARGGPSRTWTAPLIEFVAKSVADLPELVATRYREELDVVSHEILRGINEVRALDVALGERVSGWLGARMWFAPPTAEEWARHSTERERADAIRAAAFNDGVAAGRAAKRAAKAAAHSVRLSAKRERESQLRGSVGADLKAHFAAEHARLKAETTRRRKAGRAANSDTTTDRPPGEGH